MVIKEVLDEVRRPHKSSGKFSISSVGNCWRKKYMEMKGLYRQDYDARMQRIFDIGDSFHRQTVREFLEKGDSAGIRVIAAEVLVPEHQYISGRADLILFHSGFNEKIIVDIKSASDWTFNKVVLHDYSEIGHYIKQVQLYLHFFKVQKGYLLFVSKNKAHVEEVEVIYDQKLCEGLVEDIEHFMKDYVAKDILPPQCDGGQWGCEACGVRGTLKKEIPGIDTENDE
jgi:hypothetical protein